MHPGSTDGTFLKGTIGATASPGIQNHDLPTGGATP